MYLFPTTQGAATKPDHWNVLIWIIDIYSSLSAPNCGPNSDFVLEATSCPATCADESAPEKCNLPPVSGCVCRPGYLRDGDDCVKPEMCGCPDANEYHRVSTFDGERLLYDLYDIYA